MRNPCSTDVTLAMRLAVELARDHGNGTVSDVHLLLGVLRNSKAGADILQAASVDPIRIRSEAEKMLRSGTRASGDDGYVAAVGAAFRKAGQCRHAEITVEHLLFGLMANESGVLTRILADLGMSRRPIDRVVKKRLSKLAVQKLSNDKPTTQKCGKMAMILPHTIGSRIATGIFSLFTLAAGSLGCWVCTLDQNAPAGQNKRDVMDCVAQLIIFELCLLVAMTSAASFVWAIAAPKWLETILERLAKRTLFWLTVLFFISMAMIILCIVFVALKH
jgi:hypothetical protein